MTKHAHVWEDDGHCYLCGKHNPEGLKLEFALDGREITTAFTAEKRHQGYKNVLHGGLLAMVLDEVMVMLPYRLFGTVNATAEFTVRLHAPVPIGARVTVRAMFAGRAVAGQRAYAMKAEARTDDGKVAASATGTCVKVAG